MLLWSVFGCMMTTACMLIVLPWWWYGRKTGSLPAPAIVDEMSGACGAIRSPRFPADAWRVWSLGVWKHRVPVLAVGFVIFGTVIPYGLWGRPDLPSVTHAGVENDIPTLLARVEAHLALSPEDGQGWDVLAPVYLRLGRYPDAVRAYTRAVDLAGIDADRLTGLGESLTFLHGGILTVEAWVMFSRAHALDPSLLSPRVHMARAREQAGDTAGAMKAWQDLVTDVPEDHFWFSEVTKRLRFLSPRAGKQNPVTHRVGQRLPSSMIPDIADGKVMGTILREWDGDLTRRGGKPAEWLEFLAACTLVGPKGAAGEALTRIRTYFEDDSSALALLEEWERGQRIAAGADE